MPYDPIAPTERERSAAYFVIWIGLAASLLVVAGTVLPLSERLRGFGAAIAGLEMLVFALSPRFDSYFRRLRDFGAVAGVSIVALWLAANGLGQMIGGAYAAGVAVGSGGATVHEAQFVLPARFADPWLVGGLAAFGFHAGFLFAQWRGR